MRPWLRTLWRSQPAWLRRFEMRAFTGALAAPLNSHRPLLEGDAVVGGFFGTASGLGEGARQMLRQFQEIGIRTQVANVSRFAVLEDFDAGPLWPESATPGGIAIFHVNPDIFNLVLAAIGRQRLQQRRIVGYWAWELGVIPRKWIATLRCVDEVWVVSRFIADAVQKAVPDAKVYVVPIPVDVAGQFTEPRVDPLPQFRGRPIVLFAYDVRSTISRKNPEAVIEAFRRATAGDPEPVLVLKVNNERAWPDARKRLERAVARLENVHVIRHVLPGDGMKNLIARADIVMSLHRSEGFGLLMAEAMAAAKPVIATGWSGNLDFMTLDCSVLVNHKLIPVRDPYNIYNGYGAHWAEPDIDEAAAALRRLLDHPSERQRLGQAARAHVLQVFSPLNWHASLPESFWQSLSEKWKVPVQKIA